MLKIICRLVSIRSNRLLRLITGVLVLLLGVTIFANAQNDFTRIYGSEERSIPMPSFTGTPGQKDTSAIQELIDYLKAVNITAWKGMQATGTFADNLENSSHATLSILNGDNFRLDVQTARGERSTRISGSNGKTLETDGKSFFMPPATAKAGLIAFPRLLVATFPSTTTSFIDDGQVQIEGRALHRLTVAEPAFPSEAGAGRQNISVVDLYFDPSTHLLVKSASAVQLDSLDRQRYLIVVTYDDYQKVQDGVIPFRYSQSLNGQSQWTLQLTGVNVQPPADSSYFRF